MAEVRLKIKEECMVLRFMIEGLCISQLGNLKIHCRELAPGVKRITITGAHHWIDRV